MLEAIGWAILGGVIGALVVPVVLLIIAFPPKSK